MSALSFAQPLKFTPLPRERLLVHHVPSGAWVMIREGDRARVATLANAINLGRLDRICDLDDPILAPFAKAGLLRERGSRPVHETKNAGPVRMLILKLVGYCNLACTYCYDFNSESYTARLSVEDAELAIEQALSLSEDGLQLLFHGGEPLLAFKAVTRLTAFARTRAAALGRKVSFSIQTNGTRFTDEVVSLLLDEDVRIGLSIDGPPELNDMYRIDHRRRGSSKRIEEALAAHPELLPKIGALTTVTASNVDRLADIIDYVRSLGIRSWDATLFQEAGRGSQADNAMAPTVDRVVSAWLAMLDRVDRGDYDDIRVSPVLHYVHNVLTYARNNICMRGGGCGAARELISIAADGSIEACDCLKIPKLTLGRIDGGGLAAARASEAADAIRSRTQNSLRPCASCDVRAYCGGTCLAKAGALDAIDDTECALALALFPEIFRRLARSDGLELYARLHP
ncbi:radical SAM protein [Sphingomonas sp.]|uniref:radical SAM protein n=1 Tax=Sphingomonas sp. TaxID=28214 RepID=UPI003B3B369A